jgi:hypothetical protein
MHYFDMHIQSHDPTGHCLAKQLQEIHLAILCLWCHFATPNPLTQGGLSGRGDNCAEVKEVALYKV